MTAAGKAYVRSSSVLADAIAFWIAATAIFEGVVLLFLHNAGVGAPVVVSLTVSGLVSLVVAGVVSGREAIGPGHACVQIEHRFPVLSDDDELARRLRATFQRRLLRLRRRKAGWSLVTKTSGWSWGEMVRIRVLDGGAAIRVSSRSLLFCNVVNGGVNVANVKAVARLLGATVPEG
jgi:hypothetical protein